MLQRTIRCILTLFALALAFATIVLAQSPTSAEASASNVGNISQFAHVSSPSKHKLFVVTIDQPNRRQTCRIQFFTRDKLVCSRSVGGSRTYLPQQVVALLLPGNDDLRRELVLGFNGALGASIWGTVVLAAACPVCAVATGIAALWFFSAAGVTLICDDQPDRLLYLAPGQKLSAKLGYIHH